MAKRFTDPDKWEDPWFYDLSLEAKMFWAYMVDHCDNGGIWKINLKFIEKNFGFKPNLLDLSERIVMISDDKLVVKTYCKFQHGSLDSGSGYVKSAIKCLAVEGLDVFIVGGELRLPVESKEGLKWLQRHPQDTPETPLCESKDTPDTPTGVTRIEKKRKGKKRNEVFSLRRIFDFCPPPDEFDTPEFRAAFRSGCCFRNSRHAKQTTARSAKMAYGFIKSNAETGFKCTDSHHAVFLCLLWIANDWKAPVCLPRNARNTQAIKLAHLDEHLIEYSLIGVSESEQKSSFQEQKPRYPPDDPRNRPPPVIQSAELPELDEPEATGELFEQNPVETPF